MGIALDVLGEQAGDVKEDVVAVWGGRSEAEEVDERLLVVFG